MRLFGWTWNWFGIGPGRGVRQWWEGCTRLIWFILDNALGLTKCNGTHGSVLSGCALIVGYFHTFVDLIVEGEAVEEIDPHSREMAL
jgi:hypothetical protein